MPLTNTQYASIMRQYDDIKTANRHLQSDRYKEVTALCPDIADIDSEIIDLSIKTARARIEADSSDTTTDELASSLKSLNNRKVAALASIGKPADYLDDIFTCPYCKDSGYVDGKRCMCFSKKAIDLIYKDSNLKNITTDENFDTFSFSWYNNTDIDPATGLTPYIICRKFSKYVTISSITLTPIFLICYLLDRLVSERHFFPTVLQGLLWIHATVLFTLLLVSSLIHSRAMILRNLEVLSLTLHFLLNVTCLLLTTLEQIKLQIIIFLICLILLMKGFLEERVLLYLLTLRCLILRQGTHREFSQDL